MKRWWSTFFRWALIAFFLLSNTSTALARNQRPYEWEEVRTKSFAVIYPDIEGSEKEAILSLYQGILPPDQRNLGYLILIAYGDTLEKEYQRAINLFGTTLEIPISVRVYPRERDFIFLNAYAPKILPGATHSHIGDGEISLIVENIIKNPLQWEYEALNAFRYEISSLLVEKLSKGKAPPALIESVSFYLLEPDQTLPSLISQVTELPSEDISLVELWGKSNLALSPDDLVRSTSVVALLVEKFGWPKVLTFLKTIPTTADISFAFETTFNMPLDSTFRDLWLLYYPFYLEDRWRVHFLYNIDENTYQYMIQSGAYTDAKTRLEEHIHILQSLGEDQKVQKLQELLDTAKLGFQGLSLLQQVRQSYLVGNAELSLDQLHQAEAIFRQINDVQRLEEVDALRESILQAQMIAKELERQKWIAFFSLSPKEIDRLLHLMARLIRLGNQKNTEQIQEILNFMKIRSVVIFGVSLSLLIFFSYRRLRARLKRLDQEPYL